LHYGDFQKERKKKKQTNKTASVTNPIWQITIAIASRKNENNNGLILQKCRWQKYPAVWKFSKKAKKENKTVPVTKIIRQLYP
jgi:hypothetical protein